MANQLLQGLTLKPLLRAPDLHDDDPVGRELRAARERALRAELARFVDDGSPVAYAVRQAFTAHLTHVPADPDEDAPTRSSHGELHRDALQAARQAVIAMRANDEIGDDAFHRLEEELDWIEMDFRLFLLRHTGLLRMLFRWTVRLVPASTFESEIGLLYTRPWSTSQRRCTRWSSRRWSGCFPNGNGFPNRAPRLRTHATSDMAFDDLKNAVRAGTCDRRGMDPPREASPQTFREFAQAYKERHVIAKRLALARSID